MKKLLARTPEEKRTINKCALLFLILVILDQISKYFIVVYHNQLVTNPITVIPGFFRIVSVRNTGAAFGMFANRGIALFLIAIVAFIILICFYKTITEGWTERYYALALILSGIIGNSVDRILRKAVVDFADFFLGSYHWPAFNVADSAICIGVGILILSFLIRPTEPTEK